jgi:hypothetical protein
MVPDQCGSCQHFNMETAEPPNADPMLCDAGRLTCTAFPDWPGIPDEILFNEFNHNRPHPGDHGIQRKEV